ncbi:MAG: DNA-directed RNA polymerase subunit alpha [Bifidobacteriaceae bacterium]|nr:DNA-directed RNA polymerase subunit alpha [Bifidobacteriaceae bacterium]
MLIAQRPKLTEEVISESRSKFTIEPLEPGFGYTLGNSLRRTLLSSIPGAAITYIRIDGVFHEFDTIDGVKEDVTEIILNLKQIVVSSDSDVPVPVTLDVSTKGLCTAKDIQVPTGVVIHDETQHIATLNDKARLKIDMTIERGRGYVPAEMGKTDDLPAGVLPIDAIYSPVLRVTYSVDATRVEQRTDFDKLTIDVNTKSSITPRTAFASAGSTLVELFGLARALDESAEGVEIGSDEFAQYAARVAREDSDNSLESLGITKRTINSLNREGVETVADLITRSKAELLEFRNFGGKSIILIEENLAKRGLKLRDDDDPGEFEVIG